MSAQILYFLGMESSLIIREGGNEEAEPGVVLLMLERNSTDHLDPMYRWYKTLKVKMDQRSYEVHIQRNFQVLDVLIAFEQYLQSENLIMTYKDFYQRYHVIPREKWIADFQNEEILYLSIGSYREGKWKMNNCLIPYKMLQNRFFFRYKYLKWQCGQFIKIFKFWKLH